jgi:hypothetical protein
MADYVEPLEPTVWFSRIDKIASGGLLSVEHCLRHAMHLLLLTPLPLRPNVGLAIKEDVFEAFLEAGDFDAAAKHLIAQPAALSVNASDGAKRIDATIRCSVLNRTIVGRGDTVAAAVLDAWTSCLLTVRAEFGADLIRLERQHSSRSGTPRDRRLLWR